MQLRRRYGDRRTLLLLLLAVRHGAPVTAALPLAKHGLLLSLGLGLLLLLLLSEH